MLQAIGTYLNIILIHLFMLVEVKSKHIASLCKQDTYYHASHLFIKINRNPIWLENLISVQCLHAALNRNVLIDQTR